MIIEGFRNNLMSAFRLASVYTTIMRYFKSLFPTLFHLMYKSFHFRIIHNNVFFCLKFVTRFKIFIFTYFSLYRTILGFGNTSSTMHMTSKMFVVSFSIARNRALLALAKTRNKKVIIRQMWHTCRNAKNQYSSYSL